MRFKPGSMVKFKSGSIMPNSAGRVDHDFSEGTMGTVITCRRREIPIPLGDRGVELKIVEVVEVLWGTGIFQTLTSTSLKRARVMNSKKNNRRI